MLPIMKWFTSDITSVAFTVWMACDELRNTVSRFSSLFQLLT